jgi:hypothetical protein
MWLLISQLQTERGFVGGVSLSGGWRCPSRRAVQDCRILTNAHPISAGLSKRHLMVSSHSFIVNRFRIQTIFAVICSGGV